MSHESCHMVTLDAGVYHGKSAALVTGQPIPLLRTIVRLQCYSKTLTQVRADLGNFSCPIVNSKALFAPRCVTTTPVNEYDSLLRLSADAGVKLVCYIIEALITCRTQVNHTALGQKPLSGETNSRNFSRQPAQRLDLQNYGGS